MLYKGVVFFSGQALKRLMFYQAHGQLNRTFEGFNCVRNVPCYVHIHI